MLFALAFIQHVAEQAPAPQAAPDTLTYKVIIGGMGAFILMLITWLKSKDDKIEKIQAERVSDLKDQFRSVK